MDMTMSFNSFSQSAAILRTAKENHLSHFSTIYLIFSQTFASRFEHKHQRYQNQRSKERNNLWNENSKVHVEQRNFDKTESTILFFRSFTYKYLFSSQLQRQKSDISYAKRQTTYTYAYIHRPCLNGAQIQPIHVFGELRVCVSLCVCARCTSNYKRQIKTFNNNLLFSYFFRYIGVRSVISLKWIPFFHFHFVVARLWSLLVIDAMPAYHIDVLNCIHIIRCAIARTIALTCVCALCELCGT